MCGIAGILSSPPSYSLSDVRKMTDAIRHRGPDGEGHWCNPSGTVLFGHRRLAVIDLSAAAAQPMHWSDRFTIVYNGEIYNHIELRETLLSKGYHFRTQSDTEVILAAYDCYGRDCANQLDGMFAFAIWDEKERQLFAARDAFGEKPFYYHFNPDQKQLFFASELKAFQAIGLPLSVDESQLLLYLSTGSISTHPDSKKTFYKDYYKLPAAHTLHYSPAKGEAPDIKPYWQLQVTPSATSSEREALEIFRENFRSSIAKRLRSDVAIGTSLSGGLDSSSVVATIDSIIHGSEHYQRHSFTAVFDGYEKDESANAKTVAAQFDLQSHWVHPDAEDFAHHIESLILHHEEPISSASVFAQYKVYEAAKKNGVTVLLDGQGADEVLAGYDKYRHWYLQELLFRGRFSQFQNEKMAGLHQTPWSYRNYLAAFFPTLAAEKLSSSAIQQAKSGLLFEESFLKNHFRKELFYKPVVKRLNDLLLYDTCSGRLEELLRYADRNSMAHGREVRLPFLQKELVQFLFNLPSSLKIKQGHTKWLLRKSMDSTLPSSIVWRRDKIGFEPPQKEWMKQGRLIELIRRSKETLVEKGVLKEGVLLQKIQPHDSYAAVTTDWRYLVAGVLYR